MKKILPLIIAFGMMYSLISCGNEAPVVNFPMFHILIYEKDAFSMQNDSIFISIYFKMFDDNGMDDIEKVRVIHVESEYSWTVPVAMLSQTIWQNETWYGIPFIEYNNAQSILLGEYVIEVSDKGGNINESVITVEIDDKTMGEYVVPDIPYQIEIEDNKEVQITGDDYYSAELKFITEPALFNNGRKKYKRGEKMYLNAGKPKEDGAIISLRVNKDVNETIVYFLKAKTLKNNEK